MDMNPTTLDEEQLIEVAEVGRKFIFLRSLGLDEGYLVMISKIARLRGIKSLPKFENRIRVMANLGNETLKKFIPMKLVGLANIFKIASGMSEDEQKLYYHAVIPKCEQKTTGTVGVHGDDAIRVWGEVYDKGKNITNDDKRAVNNDLNPKNPYYDNIPD